MEKLYRYQCIARREITVEIFSGSDMFIKSVDEVDYRSYDRRVAAQADFSEGKSLIRRCGRCIGKPLA